MRMHTALSEAVFSVRNCRAAEEKWKNGMDSFSSVHQLSLFFLPPIENVQLEALSFPPDLSRTFFAYSGVTKKLLCGPQMTREAM